jgi:hypothetical protein
MNEELKRGPADWEWAAAFACFVGSFLSLAAGFVLTTGAILKAEIHPLLHALGLTLLIIGIPLLILGGHFMDLREHQTRTH